MNNIRAKGGRPDKIIFNSDVKRAYVGDTMVYNLSDFTFESTTTDITFPVNGGNMNLGFTSMFTGPDNENESCKFELIVPDWITYEESTFSSQSYVLTATSNSTALDARKGEIIAKQKYSNKEIKIKVFQDCNFGVLYEKGTTDEGCYYMMPISERLITYQQAVDNNLYKDDIEGIVCVLKESGVYPEEIAVLIYKELLETWTSESPDQEANTGTVFLGQCGDYSFLFEDADTSTTAFTPKESKRNTLYMYASHKRNNTGSLNSVLDNFDSPKFSNGQYGYLSTVMSHVWLNVPGLFQMMDRINLIFNDEQKQTSNPITAIISTSYDARNGFYAFYATRISSEEYTFPNEYLSFTIDDDQGVNILSGQQRAGMLLMRDLNAEQSITAVRERNNSDPYHNGVGAMVWASKYSGDSNDLLVFYNAKLDNAQKQLLPLIITPENFSIYNGLQVTGNSQSITAITYDYTVRKVINYESTELGTDIIKSWEQRKDLLLIFDDDLVDDTLNAKYGVSEGDTTSLPEGIYIHGVNGYLYTEKVWKLHNYKSIYADGIVIKSGVHEILYSKAHGNTNVSLVQTWKGDEYAYQGSPFNDYAGYSNWNKIKTLHSTDTDCFATGSNTTPWFFSDTDVYLASLGEAYIYLSNSEEAERLITLIGGSTVGDKTIISSTITENGTYGISKSLSSASTIFAEDTHDKNTSCYMMCRRLQRNYINGYIDEVKDGVYYLNSGVLYNCYFYETTSYDSADAIVIKKGNSVLGFVPKTNACRLCNSDTYDTAPDDLKTTELGVYRGASNTEWLYENGCGESGYAAYIADNTTVTFGSASGSNRVVNCFIGSHTEWVDILKTSTIRRSMENFTGVKATLSDDDGSWVSTLTESNSAEYIGNEVITGAMSDLVSDNDRTYVVKPVFIFTL